MKFLNFFLFLCVSFALLDLDLDSYSVSGYGSTDLIKSGSSPDPKHCSEVWQYRMIEYLMIDCLTIDCLTIDYLMIDYLMIDYLMIDYPITDYRNHKYWNINYRYRINHWRITGLSISQVLYQHCGSEMFIPDQTKEGKKFLVQPFFVATNITKLKLFYSWTGKEKIWANLQKNCHQALNMFWSPGSGSGTKPFPDPGSRGQNGKGSGSATLFSIIWIDQLCLYAGLGLHHDPMVVSMRLLQGLLVHPAHHTELFSL